MKRGACSFAAKAINAEAAGAEAAIIFNQGNADGRFGIIGGTLGGSSVTIPVLDNDKHYWVGESEVDKLLERGKGWLAGHPERKLITDRYLR